MKKFWISTALTAFVVCDATTGDIETNDDNTIRTFASPEAVLTAYSDAQPLDDIGPVDFSALDDLVEHENVQQQPLATAQG